MSTEPGRTPRAGTASSAGCSSSASPCTHPNPLRGLPQDSGYLHQFLTQNPALHGQPVVLVAHSYGGAVATAAAVGAPNIKALVYVDAFIPDQGTPSPA